MQTAIKTEQKQTDDPVVQAKDLQQLLEENRLLRSQLIEYEKLIKLYEEQQRLATLQRFAANSEKSKIPDRLF